MKSPARAVLAFVAVAVIGIQFVPVERSNPPVETEVPAPPAVREVLVRSCFDCHSNQTVWPWYSRVAPISWLVAQDVQEGREHLNFSTWNRFDEKRKQRKMHEIWEKVSEGEMPLWYYLPAHPDARLSDQDRALLREWTGATGSGGHDGHDDD